VRGEWRRCGRRRMDLREGGVGWRTSLRLWRGRAGAEWAGWGGWGEWGAEMARAGGGALSSDGGGGVCVGDTPYTAGYHTWEYG
jgi:hypothetical protein